MYDVEVMNRKRHQKMFINKVVCYFFLVLLGFIMVYPLLWMVGASFKTNNEIFSSISLIPKHPLWNGYSDGWKGVGQYSFSLPDHSIQSAGRLWLCPLQVQGQEDPVHSGNCLPDASERGHHHS